MKKTLSLAAVALAFTMLAQTNPPVSAPDSGAITAAMGTNGNATVRPPTEIQIESETGQLDGKANVIVYRGSVRVTDDPQMKLTCDVFTVEAPRLIEGKFYRATAETNVVIDFLNNGLTNHATSDKVVYTYSTTNAATNAFVVLSGNPVVTNRNGHYAGDEIIWDRISNKIDIKHPQMSVRPSGTNSMDLFGPTGEAKPEAPKLRPQSWPNTK